MRLDYKIDKAALCKIVAKGQRGLEGAAAAIHDDLTAAGTMPFKTGHLQNQATSVNTSNLADNTVSIVTDAVYARRKYFEPGLNFDKSVNRAAGGRWFEPYISGAARGLWLKAFVKSMRGGKK